MVYPESTARAVHAEMLAEVVQLTWRAADNDRGTLGAELEDVQ